MLTHLLFLQPHYGWQWCEENYQQYLTDGLSEQAVLHFSHSFLPRRMTHRGNWHGCLTRSQNLLPTSSWLKFAWWISSLMWRGKPRWWEHLEDNYPIAPGAEWIRDSMHVLDTHTTYLHVSSQGDSRRLNNIVLPGLPLEVLFLCSIVLQGLWDLHVWAALCIWAD